MSDSEPTLPCPPEPIYSAVVEVYALEKGLYGFVWTFSDGYTSYQIATLDQILAMSPQVGEREIS